MTNYFIIRSSFLKIIIVSFVLIFFNKTSKSQSISDFENLSLQSGTYWNGSDLSGGFSSGNAFFENKYDTSYGGSWCGFVYSNITDDTTYGYSNQYSVIIGKGYNNSSNYGLYYYSPYAQASRLKLLFRDTVLGFYVTNSTWAALSMLNGDSFSKKFGGTSGNDPDWFKLSITGYLNGIRLNDTVNFFLADFRFVNNSQDYILNNWSWIDLSSLGLVDSLEFSLSSSDTGVYGMNTPAYFCLDNFTTKSNSLNVNNLKPTDLDISISPNPAKENIKINFNNNNSDNYIIEILDIYGEILFSKCTSGQHYVLIDLKSIPVGLNLIKIKSGNKETCKRFIKL